MASASRLTHDGSTCFLDSSRTREHPGFVVRSGEPDVLADLAGVERPRRPQGSGEGPPPFGLGQAVRVGVQPSPPARQPPTFVDDHPPGHRDHAQQLTDQGPPLAADTSPHRGNPVGLVLGYPPRALNRS